MNEMLEITKQVFTSRLGDLPPTERDMKLTREYFEKGCLCVDGGDLPLPDGEPDNVACLYFIMWCGCSRHYDNLLRHREVEKCHWACTGCDKCGSSGHGGSWF